MSGLFKIVYRFLELLPLLGRFFRRARPLLAHMLGFVIRVLVVAKEDPLGFPRRVAANIKGRWTRWYENRKLVPLEFDESAQQYSDIYSMVQHNNREKQKHKNATKAIYDLRSGLILRMVMVVDRIFDHFLHSFDLTPEDFEPRKLLYASCGLIDIEGEALSYFRSALDHNPNLAEARYALAFTLRERGQLEEAVAEFRRAASLPPTMLIGKQDISVKARAWFDCGMTLEDLGHADEAAQCYEEAVAAAPDFSEAHRKLGEYLRQKGEVLRAAKHFDSAMRYRMIIPTLPALPDRLAPAAAEREGN